MNCHVLLNTTGFWNTGMFELKPLDGSQEIYHMNERGSRDRKRGCIGLKEKKTKTWVLTSSFLFSFGMKGPGRKPFDRILPKPIPPIQMAI